jgi:predicted nucleic acid-binding protein
VVAYRRRVSRNGCQPIAQSVSNELGGFVSLQPILRHAKRAEKVSAVLDELALVRKRVELMIRTGPILLDPNDEMVQETAINGRADAIVTFNDRDFRPVAARFRYSVVRPGVVIRGLAKETK